jgi:hypothetical protein
MLDRAARLPRGQPPARTPRAAQLRAMSRLLGVAGHLADNPAALAMLRLIVNLSLLADALAELRESQRRIHQARAARTAARLLRMAADDVAGSATTPPADALTGSPGGRKTSLSAPRRATRNQQPHPTGQTR